MLFPNDVFSFLKVRIKTTTYFTAISWHKKSNLYLQFKTRKKNIINIDRLTNKKLLLKIVNTCIYVAKLQL